MSSDQTQDQGGAGPARGATASADEPNLRIDWRAIEESPEFRELVVRRRRFVAPVTAAFLGAYLGFLILSGYATGFMGTVIFGSLSVGYALMLAMFVLVGVLMVLYLRRADKVFDPLARRVRDKALGAGAGSVSRPGSIAYDSSQESGDAPASPSLPNESSGK
jgi:uncharacterized membrane protein (DUF485 family)